jgi:hypothetical protein
MERMNLLNSPTNRGLVEALLSSNVTPSIKVSLQNAFLTVNVQRIYMRSTGWLYGWLYVWLEWDYFGRGLSVEFCCLNNFSYYQLCTSSVSR